MLNNARPNKDFKNGNFFNTNLTLNYAARQAQPNALNNELN
jgi:hypothetical protein